MTEHTRILAPVHPNPSRGTALIGYTLTVEACVDLEVYDIRGRLVRNLKAGVREDVGLHQIRWRGLDGKGLPVPSGVYVLRIQVDSRTESQKMVFIR